MSVEYYSRVEDMIINLKTIGVVHMIHMSCHHMQFICNSYEMHV